MANDNNLKIEKNKLEVSKNVPELRFQGFLDAWELRKLGELGSVAMNKRIFKEETADIGDIPFYKIGTFGSQPDAFISRELFDEYKTKYPYPTIGDLLISASGSIGRIVEYKGEDAYFQDSNIVWLKHDCRLENSFLKQYYAIVRWKGLEGSTIKRLYNRNILETKISISSPSEQRKLGSFFKQLDDTITLHQRKLDKLKRLKQGYLQQLFPKNDEKVPSVRFANFDEDWRHCRLGELVSITSGFTGDASLNEGQYELTRIETIATGQVDLNRVGYSNIEPTEKYLLNKGDILFSNINSLSHIGKTSLFNLNTKLYHGINLLRLQPTEADSQFLYQSFQIRVHLEWAKNHANQAVNQASINQTELATQVFLVPSKMEQVKVGSFFKQLDDTITLHQSKLDNLKSLKQALLQKMFI